MSTARPLRHLAPVPARLAVAVVAASLLLALGCATERAGAPRSAPGAISDRARSPKPTAGFTFLGEALIPKAPPAVLEPLRTHAAPVGGLSGLVFDPASGDYLAISDSRGEHGPVRAYTLEIGLRPDSRAASGSTPSPANHLAANGARVLAVTHLLDRDGAPFAEGTVDPEGIALAPGGGFYVSSEGVAEDSIAPFVRRYADDGRMLGALPVPEAYRPETGRHPHGVRKNLGFEPLAVTPPTSPPLSSTVDGLRYLFTGTENALAQDGPKATVDHGCSSRLLRWSVAADGSVDGPPVEWVYPVSPVAQAPPPSHPQPDGLPVAGLVELIALGPHDLLALERSYTDGVGTTERLYRVRLDGATPVTGRASLADGGRPVPARKTLLLDVSEALAAHGVPTDNLEGMTFGPDLPDGRRLLLLVSDDNFSGEQRTQVVAFAVEPAVLSIP